MEGRPCGIVVVVLGGLVFGGFGRGVAGSVNVSGTIKIFGSKLGGDSFNIGGV